MKYISLQQLTIFFTFSLGMINFSISLCNAFLFNGLKSHSRLSLTQCHLLKKTTTIPGLSNPWNKNKKMMFFTQNGCNGKVGYHSTRLFSSSINDSKDNSVIGFIGLGIMGNGMARCLLRENVPLKVWNRSGDKSEKLRSEYPELVAIASSPAEVVSQCSLTFSMLSTPEACKNVYSTKDTGILAGINENTKIVDCATLEQKNMVEFSSEVISRGGKFLEAPVSGSKGPAANGQLIFLSAGDKDVYEDAEKYFQIMGKSSYHLGEIGKGTEMKLIVNMIMGSMLSSLAEGISICNKTGMDNTTLIKILSEGAMANPMFNLKGPLISDDDHAPNFPLKHAHKDMKFALSLAEKVGAQVNVAKESTKYMEKQIKKGDGDLDFSVLAREVGQRLSKSEL